MLLIVGTAPEADLPLIEGEARLTGPNLLVAGREIPVNRGTAALVAAAVTTLASLHRPPPVRLSGRRYRSGRGQPPAL